MFDFAWSEIALIGVVALVLIGPKDLPIAIKTVAGVVKKMRKMAGEFQSQVDEMVKDTSLAEVRQQIAEIRNMDIRGEIERAVDQDGSIRSAFADDPFRSPSYVPPAGEHSILAPGGADPAHPPEPEAPLIEPPGFVPPAFVPPGTATPSSLLVPAPPPPAPAPPEPPSFIPPSSPPPAAPQA
jgi:sec-independent protein translocase protein TatB